MLSNASSQHGFGHPRLAAISSTGDADVPETCRQDVVNPRRNDPDNAAEVIELDRVEQAELLGATGQ